MPDWVKETSEIHAEVSQIEDLDAILGNVEEAEEAEEEEGEDGDSHATDENAAVDIGEAAPEEQGADDEKQRRKKKKKVESAKKTPQLTTQQMLEAGLGDEEDVYLKVHDLKFVKQRTIGPDVLDVITRSYKLKGTNAMRLLLRSRGAPDKTNSALPVSPKQIKDLAAQLGILGTGFCLGCDWFFGHESNQRNFHCDLVF